jgi:phosphoribosylaminoimidazolecarboxamide formyltransferase / IMP cyclohydrolase
MSSIRKAYRSILKDFFPQDLAIEMGGSKLIFKKRTWKIPNSEGIIEEKGLRYGDNPDQPAAIYQWVDGEILLGDLLIKGGKPLVTAIKEENFIQFGKHPGKTNLTDVNAGIGILINLSKSPAGVIIKHNNPCGVAIGATIAQAYNKAYYADRIAAMGGCIVLNRPVTIECAESIASSYSEVVVAPSYEEGTIEILKSRKNLRIISLPVVGELDQLGQVPNLNISTMKDGGLVVELSQISRISTPEDFIIGKHKYKGEKYSIAREPTEGEYQDLLMAWSIAGSVTSNSIVMVKDGVTTAIGTGEQDRVGAVRLAIRKAFTKHADSLAFKKFGISIFQLEQAVADKKRDAEDLLLIEEQTEKELAGLRGSALASDGFFPFRDGVDAALKYGVSAIVQPGGSIRDYESINACNESGATMVFTNQRAFKH